MISQDTSIPYVDSGLAFQSRKIQDGGYAFYWDERRWSPERTIPFVCGPTARTIGELAIEHDMSQGDFVELLEGKTVLDIGGGKSHLQDELNRAGVNSHVINLDLFSAFNEELGYKSIGARIRPNGAESAVVGFAEQMPFRDESIDVALATYSVPFYTNTADDFESIMNESLRVLKVGGFASFAPFTCGFLGDNAIVGRTRMLGMVRSMSTMPELEVSYENPSSPLHIHKVGSFKTQQ